ncbi:MAG: hypothetical protein WCH04_12310 [Gammaproteobacteria bacterium]
MTEGDLSEGERMRTHTYSLLARLLYASPDAALLQRLGEIEAAPAAANPAGAKLAMPQKRRGAGAAAGQKGHNSDPFERPVRATVYQSMGSMPRGCYRRTGDMETGDTVLSLPLQPPLSRWLGWYILEHQD